MILDTPIGTSFNGGDMLDSVHAVWGGVAWPAERKGYAVIIAATRELHMGGHDIYLLDEFETNDTRELVRQCAALSDKHWLNFAPNRRRGRMGRWIGDKRNEPGSKFIQEMNEDFRKFHKPDTPEYRPELRLYPTTICEMDNLYSFMLPRVKELINPNRRRLFLKQSDILGYLNELDGDEIAELKLGAYPAIEALAFAVIGLQRFMKGELHRTHSKAHEGISEKALMEV